MSNEETIIFIIVTFVSGALAWYGVERWLNKIPNKKEE